MGLEGKTESKVSLKGTILTNQQVFDMIEKHKNNTENPHNVTLEQLFDVLPIKHGGTGSATAKGAMENITGLYEDSDYPGCYYRIVDGEKAWTNPPMLAGVEYMTIERYLGLPVYVKTYDCGMCGKGRTSIELNLPSSYMIVRYFSGNTPFFYGDQKPGYNIYDSWVSVAHNYINVHRNEDSQLQYYCTVFYTKGGD